MVLGLALFSGPESQGYQTISLNAQDGEFKCYKHLPISPPTSVKNSSEYTHMYIIYIYVYVCMYIYVDMYICIYICIHRYMMFLLTGPIGLPWEVSRAQIRLDCLTNISV